MIKLIRSRKQTNHNFAIPHTQQVGKEYLVNVTIDEFNKYINESVSIDGEELEDCDEREIVLNKIKNFVATHHLS
jgi:hypothetical protein